MKHIAAACLVASLSMLTTTTAARAEEPIEPVRVVTTLTVLAALVAEVGGQHVHVESLSDPRQDPHFVSPRPTLMKRVREADALVEIGLQLELWAQKVIDGSGNARVQMGQVGRIVASAGIPTLERPLVLSRTSGDVHPDGNPHVWLDPINAKRMARNIADGLAAVSPQLAATFDENAKTFSHRLDVALFGASLVDKVGGDKLTRLAEDGTVFTYLSDRGLDRELGGWLAAAAPLRTKKVITYHKTWPYFAKRFGLGIPMQIEEKPGIAPSAQHRDAVIRLVEGGGISAIVSATFYDRRAADYIAERTGLTAVTLPIQPDAGKAGISYFDFIDYLIDTLVAATHGEP